MFDQIATFGYLGNIIPLQQVVAVVTGFFWWWFISRYRFKYWIVGLQLLLAFIVSELAGMGDSNLIILDEFVAMPLVFLGFSLRKDIRSVLIASGGIGLFGLFDWLKPLGISYLELLPGGIVLDDMGAAILACGLLWLILYTVSPMSFNYS
ncbi:MAG: phosphatidylglycerophosphatase A [Candidatus Woesearchaeota archaeon]